jgi:hypothetical protein
MGFGEEAFGEVPFGLSPQAQPARRVVPAFQAYDIDVRARDIPIDANGFYKSIHPVDHRVRLNLLIGLGVVPADQSVGSTLFSMPFDTDENMTADGNRRVRNALRQLIDDGDIQIDSLTVSGSAMSSAPGRLVFLLVYKNLRLPEDERLRRQVFESSQ